MDGFGTLIQIWKVEHLSITILLLLLQLFIQIAAPASEATDDILIELRAFSLVQIALDLASNSLEVDLRKS